jgi:hypothetical protein
MRDVELTAEKTTRQSMDSSTLQTVGSCDVTVHCATLIMRNLEKGDPVELGAASTTSNTSIGNPACLLGNQGIGRRLRGFRAVRRA